MTKKAIYGLVIGLSGFALFTMHVDWQAAVGLFFALWGNNISQGVQRAR